MNNLKKFNNEAEYNAATLNYPAVSWVVSGDTVHFDKKPSAQNDKVMFAWTSDQVGEDIVLYNCEQVGGDIFTSISVNDVEVSNPNETCTLSNASQATDYLVKYELANNTEIGIEFMGELGVVDSSNYEMFIPSIVVAVDSLPTAPSITSLVINSATPPECMASFSETPVDYLYVPDGAIEGYRYSPWGDVDNILPISQYQGNLPI